MTENRSRANIFIEQNRFSYIDILRGIGIFFVVLGHIYYNDVAYRWIYSFHMPLFFFAAGWVYKEKPVRDDIKKRLQTIVRPYFCFGMATILYWQLFEKSFRSADISFIQAIEGLVSGMYEHLSFNVHLWFLPCFFIVTVLFNALVRIGKKYRYDLSFPVVLCMSAIYIFAGLPSLPWGIDKAFGYILFYKIGSFFSLSKADKRLQAHSISYQRVCIVFLLTMSFFFSYCSINQGIMWYVTAMLGIVSAWIFSVLLHKNRILEYLGKISLVILCVHGPVYRILIKVVSILLCWSTDAVRENFILSLFLTVLTLALCGICFQIIKRFFPWCIGRQRKKAVV
ncbi:MAG: acyltransferase family protein [Faecalicoccus sp.]|uniref:acyltransferase family protein n=1 Tax=Faecalicoccus sp. TaxID=1971758 RepID=UPI002A915330|nr:acyltransferase family protein [Faecalicoccus sp.]MDY5233129.1 acyltransferase family protein [Faecalicoccus sp.]